MGILLYECLGEFGLLKCDRLLLQEKNPFFSIRKVQERKATVLFLTLQICHPHSCVFFLVFVAAGWLYHNRLTWQAEYTHLQLWTGPFWHFPKDLTCFDGFACLLGLFSPFCPVHCVEMNRRQVSHCLSTASIEFTAPTRHTLLHVSPIAHASTATVVWHIKSLDLHFHVRICAQAHSKSEK